MASQEQYDDLVKGLQLLAGVCDGASSRDGCGFSGTDTTFGRSIAIQSQSSTLSPGQQRPAIKLVQKYRGQLERMGFESLPTMKEYGEPFGEVAQRADASRDQEVMIEGRDGLLFVRFGYNIIENKDKLKYGLPWATRRFDSAYRAWKVDPKVSDDLLELFPGATLDEEAQKVIDLQESPEEPVESRPAPQMSVRIAKDRIVFRTPEYRPQWVDDCRNVPGRKFGETEELGKHWHAPTSAVQYVVETFRDRDDIDLGPALLEIYANQMSRAEKSRAAHGVLVDDLPIPDGLSPFPYQAAGYNFLREADFRGLLADDMGLGKTIQAILAIMAVRKDGPVVVSCPATVKLNWKREIEKWIPGIVVEVLEGRTPKVALDPSKVDVYVINHDILAQTGADKTKANPKGLTGWIDQFLAIRIALFVFDEGHKVGNPKSNRGAAAKMIAKEVERVIFLTGTPLPNRPRELFPILNMIDPSAWDNFFSYGKRYCGAVHSSYGWDFNGASNLEELHERIKPWVLRRTKTEVLKELPGKTRTDIVLRLTSAERRAYDKSVADFARKLREGTVEPADRLTQIGNLKQLAAEAKLRKALSWIADFVESGEKLIVFAWHRATIDAVVEALQEAKVGTVSLDGRTPVNKRQAIVDAFQEDDDVQVFVGNIQAAGEGITLTAAANVVFLEYGWKPGEHAQAEDRANRIGQDRPVTVWYLNAEDTIDAMLFQIIDGKRMVIDTILEGESREHASDVWVMHEDGIERTDQELVDALAGKLFK